MNFSSYGASIVAVSDANISFSYNFTSKSGKLEFDTEKFLKAFDRKRKNMALSYALINATKKEFDKFLGNASMYYAKLRLNLSLEEELKSENKDSIFQKLQGLALGMAANSMQASKVTLHVKFFDSIPKPKENVEHPHYVQNLNQDIRILRNFHYSLTLKKDWIQNEFKVEKESISFSWNRKMDQIVKAALINKVGEIAPSFHIRFDNMRKVLKGPDIEWQPFQLKYIKEGIDRKTSGKLNIYTDEVIWEE